MSQGAAKNENRCLSGLSPELLKVTTINWTEHNAQCSKLKPNYLELLNVNGKQ